VVAKNAKGYGELDMGLTFRVVKLWAEEVKIQQENSTSYFPSTQTSGIKLSLIGLHCGAKKLHRFIFAITFLNRDLFR